MGSIFSPGAEFLAAQTWWTLGAGGAFNPFILSLLEEKMFLLASHTRLREKIAFLNNCKLDIKLQKHKTECNKVKTFHRGMSVNWKLNAGIKTFYFLFFVVTQVVSAAHPLWKYVLVGCRVSNI